jgi:bifunctional non-homologous end joining protein LigD
MAKALRPHKIFVDWSQNNPAKTTVAPYSLRAKALPTVSTPLTWDEVEQGGQLSFTAGQVLERVEEYGDLFADVLDDAYRARITRSMVTRE